MTPDPTAQDHPSPDQSDNEADRPLTPKEQLEEGLEDTFPASDPPSATRPQK